MPEPIIGLAADDRDGFAEGTGLAGVIGRGVQQFSGSGRVGNLGADWLAVVFGFGIFVLAVPRSLQCAGFGGAGNAGEPGLGSGRFFRADYPSVSALSGSEGNLGKRAGG